MISIFLLSASFLAIYQASAQECQTNEYIDIAFPSSVSNTIPAIIAGANAKTTDYDICLKTCSKLSSCQAVNMAPNKGWTYTSFECELLLDGVGNAFEKERVPKTPDARHTRLRCPAPQSNIVYGKHAAHYPLKQVDGNLIDGEANKYSWPWMVFIQRDRDPNNGFPGVLLSSTESDTHSDLVLTAASNLIDPATWTIKKRDGGPQLIAGVKEELTVIAGKHDLLKPEFDMWTQTRRVRVIEPGEFEYQRGDFVNNDFVLLKLASAIPYSDVIRPIDVAVHDVYSDNQISDKCAIVGWTCSADSKRLPLFQHTAVLESFESCTAKDKWPGMQPSSTCLRTTLINNCNSRKPGTPLICKEKDNTWKLYGVVNYGYSNKAGKEDKTVVSRTDDEANAQMLIFDLKNLKKTYPINIES